MARAHRLAGQATFSLFLRLYLKLWGGGRLLHKYVNLNGNKD